MHTLRTITIVATIGLLAGCAAIVTGTDQNVNINATYQGQNIVATCQVSGPSSGVVNSPGTLNVDKSYDPLNIVCNATGYPEGRAVVHSYTKAMAFGNILFGGPIGAGFDVASGAAYEYPRNIEVRMGETIEIKEGN